MLEFLARFKGYNGGDEFPTMEECFCKEKYPFQDEICEYILKCPDNDELIAMPSIERDMFTGKTIGSSTYNVIFEKDGYQWRNNLAYYIKQYNLRLPKKAEDWVLKQIGIKNK